MSGKNDSCCSDTFTRSTNRRIAMQRAIKPQASSSKVGNVDVYIYTRVQFSLRNGNGLI